MQQARKRLYIKYMSNDSILTILYLNLSMSGGVHGWVMLTAMTTLSYVIAFIAWLLVSRIEIRFIRVSLKITIIAAVFPLLDFRSRAYLLPMWMQWI